MPMQVKKRIAGCLPLTNDRGPFQGQVKVSGVGMARVIVARDKMHHFLGDAPNMVAVVRPSPPMGYFMKMPCPLQAEQLGKFIEALGEIKESQLENIGFIEMRREVVSEVT